MYALEIKELNKSFGTFSLENINIMIQMIIFWKNIYWLKVV